MPQQKQEDHAQATFTLVVECTPKEIEDCKELIEKADCFGKVVSAQMRIDHPTVMDLTEY